jgi:carboxyl-terminal processing protease
MKTIIKYTALSIFLVALATACKKDTEKSEIEIVNSEIYNLLKDVYLWYNNLPDVDPADFATPQELMDVLRYDVYDRWSVVLTKDEYYSFDQGEMIGYGFMFGEDAESKVRIASVYKNTHFDVEGVKRGWIISTVNGTPATADNLNSLLGAREVGVSNDFGFINENGDTVELNIAKEIVDVSPVLHHEIIDQAGKKIGYLVFETFIRSAYPELEDVFTEFSTAGIDELIVDLRYNRGGYLTVADTLAGWIIGDNYANQPFTSLEFNAKYTPKTLNIPHMPATLDLSRVFFIGTSNTASASELVINGMKPYIETFLAGSTTHGKPVGMSVFEFIKYDYVVLPVTFKYTNADGTGDFYTGLAPDLPAEDDITRNFGDPEEASLKAVLDYIETGSLPLKSSPPESHIVRSEAPVHQYLIEK